MDDRDYTETVSVRLTKEQVERFRECARQAGMSQSELVRYWIESFDLLPVIPEEVQKNLRRYQGRRARQLILDVLQRGLSRFWRS